MNRNTGHCISNHDINPIHFGAIMIVNISCGTLIPPYASVLYFGMKVGQAKFGEMMKNTSFHRFLCADCVILWRRKNGDQWLGHADITTTLDVYTHFLKERKRRQKPSKSSCLK